MGLTQRFTPGHIIFKNVERQRLKEHFKEARKKLITNKGSPLRLIVDVSSEENVSPNDIKYKRKLSTKNNYIQKNYFKSEYKIKTFPDRQKLRQLIASRLSLKKKNTKRKFFTLKIHDPRQVVHIHTQKGRSSVMVIMQ